MILDIQKFRYALTIEKEASLTKAAEKLFTALLCRQYMGTVPPCQAIFHAAPPLSDGIG